MEKFLEVTSTLDPKIVGRDGFWFSVELSEDIVNYITEKSKDKEEYYKHFHEIIKAIPEDLICKMENRRKRTVDYMDRSPSLEGIVGVVSENFKRVVEEAAIPKKQYIFKRIRIAGQEDPFFLFCVPVMNYEMTKFKETIFTDLFLDEDIGIRYYKFKNPKEYYEASRTHAFIPYKIVLDKRYEKYDIISIRPHITYFSPRLINLLYEKGIKGQSYIARRSPSFIFLEFN